MKIASGPTGFPSLFMTHQNWADHTFWPHLRKNKQKTKTGWTTHSWNNAIWFAVRLCYMTMMSKINKLEKPGEQQGNFHALFGRSPTFYGNFRADAVTSEWSTRISSSVKDFNLLFFVYFICKWGGSFEKLHFFTLRPNQFFYLTHSAWEYFEKLTLKKKSATLNGCISKARGML